MLENVAPMELLQNCSLVLHVNIKRKTYTKQHKIFLYHSYRAFSDLYEHHYSEQILLQS